MHAYLAGRLRGWRSVQDGLDAHAFRRSYGGLVHSETARPRMECGVLAGTLGGVQELVQALVLVLQLDLLANRRTVLEVGEDVWRGAAGGRRVSLLPPLKQRLLVQAKLGREVGDVADGETQGLYFGQILSSWGHRWWQVGPEVMQSLGQISHSQLLLFTGALSLLASDPSGFPCPPAASGQRAGGGLDRPGGLRRSGLRQLLVGRRQAGVHRGNGGQGLWRRRAGDVRIGTPLERQAEVVQLHRGGIHVVWRESLVLLERLVGCDCSSDLLHWFICPGQASRGVK